MAAGNYCILRFEKIHSTRDLAGRVAHNTRERMPKNADPSKTDENQTFFGSSKTVLESFQAKLPPKVRKNAVLAVEAVVTLSAEAAERLGDKVDDYFRSAGKWLNSRLGGVGNTISVAIHWDEKVPHLHLLSIPLVDGKLSAKTLLGGSRDRMRQLQTDFAKDVGQQFGLDRGVEHSGYRHTDPKEFPRILAEAKDTLEYARGEMRGGLGPLDETVKGFTKKDVERCWVAFYNEAQTVHQEKALEAKKRATKRSSGQSR